MNDHATTMRTGRPNRVDEARIVTKRLPVGYQHVFEVLARPPAGTAVHVPLVALLELEPRTLEDLRIEARAGR